MSYGLETMRQKLEFTIPRVGDDEYGVGTHLHVLNLDLMGKIEGTGQINLRKKDFYTYNEPGMYLKLEEGAKISYLSYSGTNNKPYLHDFTLTGKTIKINPLPTIADRNSYGLYVNGKYLNSENIVLQNSLRVTTKGYNLVKLEQQLIGAYVLIDPLMRYFRRLFEVETVKTGTLSVSFYMTYEYDNYLTKQNPRFVFRFKNLYEVLSLIWFKKDGW